jgi:hypothetical protein
MQRWALTLTSRMNAWDWSNTRPSIKRRERSYFLKTQRQRSCPLPPLLSITMSRDRLLHFQCKKTTCPIPWLFQRSKVVRINPSWSYLFLNLKFENFFKCWRPPLLLAVGEWRHGSGVWPVSIWAWETAQRWGGGMEFPFANWELYGAWLLDCFPCSDIDSETPH